MNFENALNLIGAAANGERGTEPHGRTPAPASGSGEARDAGGGPRGRDVDESEVALYVRQAVVRAVRREKRATGRAGATREVVVVDFVASTETKDSHGTIIRSNWDLTRYNANPVLLWMHCRWNDTPAVGTVENLRREGASHAGSAVFDDTTQFDRDVASKYENGTLKGFSIGFYPHTIRFETHEDEEILILDDIEILEISCVNVPSNPEALAKSREALRARARAAAPSPLPAAPAPPRDPAPTPRAGATGDPMPTPSKKIVQADERAVRATDDGATLDVSCPHCEAPVEVQARALPLPVKRAAEVEALAKRAADAEGRAAETERKLALATTELDATKARAAALEPQLAEATAQNAKHQRKLVEAEVDQRIGSKVFASERATEVKLLLALLENRAPDTDSKDAAGTPTRTVGEKEYAERLAQLDARPNIGLLGPPITGTDQRANTGASADPKARSLAAEIDDLVAKQQAA